MSNWQTYNKTLTRYSDLELSIDLSLMDIKGSFYTEMQPKIDRALKDMAELEAGAIANPDEGRMEATIGCAMLT